MVKDKKNKDEFRGILILFMSFALLIGSIFAFLMVGVEQDKHNKIVTECQQTLDKEHSALTECNEQLTITKNKCTKQVPIITSEVEQPRKCNLAEYREQVGINEQHDFCETDLKTNVKKCFAIRQYCR